MSEGIQTDSVHKVLSNEGVEEEDVQNKDHKIKQKLAKDEEIKEINDNERMKVTKQKSEGKSNDESKVSSDGENEDEVEMKEKMKDVLTKIKIKWKLKFSSLA